jgi:DNA-binding NarL/FixJ family response regulator
MIAKNRRAQRLRLLIAEDSRATRQNLREVCAGLSRLEVVGEAGNGLDTIEAVRNLKPDVLTLDINMPQLNGFDVLRTMQREKHECMVIMLTSSAEEYYKEKCRELSASHFFNKITEFDQFLKLLKTI